MSINEDAWNVIKILMEDSFWGRNSSNYSLIRNLNNEVEEFISACENNDVVNLEEEAADVMMIILCLLYRNGVSGSEEVVDRVLDKMISKLKRRYAHLYNDEKSEETQEHEGGLWLEAKKIENTVNYMFCSNVNCIAFGKIGEGNIRFDGKRYICSECGTRMNVSRKTTLFSGKKERKRYVETVADSIKRYVCGEDLAAVENLKFNDRNVFDSFCHDILQSEHGLKEYFINYISNKYKLSKTDVVKYCEEAEDKYDCNELIYIYSNEINKENFDLLNQLTRKEEKAVKKILGDVTMDVLKKMEMVTDFHSQSWENQSACKYLLRYPKGNAERIIECMTIIHYHNKEVRDLTIELSNMYNCVVGCKFCASGALPEAACNLEAIDYVSQLNTCLKESGLDPNKFKNFYVSFAGIGEPSVVYKTIAAGMVMIRDLYSHVKFNIATFGYNVECFNFWGSQNFPIRTLQIPFYSDMVEKLGMIVSNLPKEYSFADVLNRTLDYKRKYPDCRVKVNFIVMKGINDSNEDIERLGNILSEVKDLITLKISYLNYTRPGIENGIVSPGKERLEQIKQYMDAREISCYIFGTFINTEMGCGQLAQNHISSMDN